MAVRGVTIDARGEGVGAAPARSREGKHGRPRSGAVGSDAAKLATVAWLPREPMALNDWVAAGRRFGLIARCSQWWIGDWVTYGNSRWGEKYAEAARITGYDAGSLRNMAWVSSQFDTALRSDKLSWSHHVLLAPLDDEEKRGWLELAIQSKLSVSDLRLELRAHRRKDRPDVQGGSATPQSKHGEQVVCPHCGNAIRPPSHRDDKRRTTD